jgi:hypothetical protein
VRRRRLSRAVDTTDGWQQGGRPKCPQGNSRSWRRIHPANRLRRAGKRLTCQGQPLLACFQPRRPFVVFDDRSRPITIPCGAAFAKGEFLPMTKKRGLPGGRPRRVRTDRDVTVTPGAGKSAALSWPVRNDQPASSGEPGGRPAVRPAGAEPLRAPAPERLLRSEPPGEPLGPVPTAGPERTAEHRWCSSSSGSSRRSTRRRDAA